MNISRMTRGGGVVAASLALVALSQGDSRPSTLASTQVVSSSIPLSCASPFDPYASGNLSLAVACGEHVFNRTATTVLSSGAIQYTYDVMGLKTIYTVPPTNFNPQSASAATLAQYGIPSPPPQGSAAYQQWSKMVSNLHFVTPPTTLVSVNSESNITSSNWSGYINTSNEQIYNTAQAYWTEPTLQASRCSHNSATFWAGLGGFNSKQLAQDGTALNVPGFGEHQAWSEALPTQSSMVAANLYATPGAQFVSSVTYEGNNNFSFYMYNFATGQATSFVVNAYGYDGSTAEYIAERPTTNGTIDNLSNFGTIDFISAETNGNSIGTYGHSAITMTDGNTTLAIPSALYGGSSFSVTQHACN